MDRTPGMQRGWNRSWGSSFDAVAEAYDAARPGYPQELYRDLTRLCGLDESFHVLEVGCGTGQATEEIAPLARNVVALEPGAALARRARTRLSAFQNVEVRETTFEDFDGEPEALDLITSATAFHWVEPEIGFVRAAKMLRPGGWLAVWWTAYEDSEEEDPFGEEVSCLISSHGYPGYAGPGYALRTDERKADFMRSESFGPVHTRRYPWRGEHSADEIRALFSTYSNVQAMDEPVRLRILDGIEEIANAKFGGHVTRPYVTALYAAQKTEDVR